MNNPFQSPVNAHLRKTAALLEQCRAIQDENGSRLTQEALVESSLFQLQLALLNFLREIAENYQVADAGKILSVSDLANRLAQIDKQPAELSEMETIEKEGWLAELKASYKGLTFSGPAKKSMTSNSTAGMIQTKQLGDTDLSYASAESWLARAKELVERQREMMVEC